ncbi:MAG: bifunctional adenosylcobinamide kinase/adenosylcobinamide-phosphate guanylyltransferase [Pseudomonadota bacterium]|nr:bifunctional adenosylcobinamide kinase/adenosylcobinamide-phosphate guanylyltransferase [Pseudomonadota bacterium]
MGAVADLFGTLRPRSVLVLGGARSGKSRLAERLSLDLAGDAPLTYIATAEAFDDEMKARIAEHRARRDGRWTTVDAPLELPAALGRCGGEVALVDCLTLWLSNLMLAERDWRTAAGDLMAALAARQGPTVLVSNETGLGIVPDTPLGRRFRDAQGMLNQQVAAAVDGVVFVAAGLPLVMKPAGGARPC